MSVSTTNTESSKVNLNDNDVEKVTNIDSDNDSPPDLTNPKESKVIEPEVKTPIDLNNTEMPEHDDNSVVEEPKKGIIGLDNMGNTCYLNAVLQTVSNLDDFRKFLFDGDFTEHLKGPLEESLFYQTFRIIKHMWESSEDSLSPKSFKKKFVEKQKQFMGFEQQDSHEAMHFLIDHLHEEIARPIKLNISLPAELNEYFDFCDKYYQRFELDKDAKIDKDVLKIFDTKLEETVDYFAMKYYNQLSPKYSAISEFFQSITCSLTKCPDCSHVSPKFDNNYMIEIEIPELDDEDIKSSELFKKIFAEKVVELKEKTDNEELIAKFCINEIKQKYIHKLNDLLMNYQKSEKLDDSNLWNCEVCEKKVNGIKQTKIFKNPQYLIIHFKRFKHIMVNGNVSIMKIKNLIGYEKYLDIKPLMLKNTENTKYELVGGINHMGEYQFGHFTNFSRNNDKWYNFNDDKVNEINCTGIPLTQNAYMLIYKRCD